MRRLVDADRVVSIEEQTAWSEIETLRDQDEESAKSGANAAELLVAASPMLGTLRASKHDVRAFLANLFAERH
ncbi:MAG: hypothetical protein WDM92_09005 [Caulobacteraceae bacterium]